MTSDTIRMGIIGAGRNTRDKHIPGLLAQPGVEIRSVANRSLASSESAARELGIGKAAADWMEILDDPEIDAVCIGTWPYMHAPITIAALERGKHVLCEARMAMDSTEARAMLAASRRRPHLVAQIVPAPTTLAFDRTVAEIIGQGRIGEIITLDARLARGSDYPDPKSALHWRHDRTLSGNNIMSMGIWYECVMRWVGPAKTVFAVGQNAVRHRLDHSGRRIAMTIPDHVDVIGELEGGGQIRLAVSSVIGHAPAVADICVFGTEGTLRFLRDAAGDSLWLAERGGPGLEQVAVDPAKKGGWRVEQEFVNAIRGVEPITHTDFATGLNYMEWTDAVTLSLRSRRSITLPLPASG